MPKKPYKNLEPESDPKRQKVRFLCTQAAAELPLVRRFRMRFWSSA